MSVEQDTKMVENKDIDYQQKLENLIDSKITETKELKAQKKTWYFDVGMVLTVIREAHKKLLAPKQKWMDIVEQRCKLKYKSAKRWMNYAKGCFFYRPYAETLPFSVACKVEASKTPADISRRLFEYGRPDITNEEIDIVVSGIRDGTITDANHPYVKELIRHDKRKEEFKQKTGEEKSDLRTAKNWGDQANAMIRKLETSTLDEDGRMLAKQKYEDVIRIQNEINEIFESHRVEPEYHLPKDE